MDDYDIHLQYHPEKVNIVPDALSRKPKTCMAMPIIQQKELFEEMRQMDVMMIRRPKAPGEFESTPRGGE